MKNVLRKIHFKIRFKKTHIIYVDGVFIFYISKIFHPSTKKRRLKQTKLSTQKPKAKNRNKRNPRIGKKNKGNEETN